MKIAKLIATTAAALALACGGSGAFAQVKEVNEIRIAQQFGLAFLPLMVVEHDKLIEKHGQRVGLPALKGVFTRLASTQGLNDALISGQIDLAPNGPPSLLTLWSRTRGTNNEIKGVIPINEIEFWLNANRPEIKTFRDFTEKDRIALTAIKVSVPAILLQMLAEKEWGRENYTRFDKQTVSMPHPDGLIALISKSEIAGHFTSPPFMHQELQKPGIHRVITSTEIMGTQFTGSIMMSSARFRDANPKAVQALIGAMSEAIDFINRDTNAAAAIYLKISGDKTNSIEEIVRQLNDNALAFTTAPRGLMKFGEFMHRTGSLKVAPASWKDLFFPEAHHLTGN